MLNQKIRKMLMLVCSLYAAIVMNFAIANNAPQCDSTWNQSSAAATCGAVCTNPMNTYHYAFSSTYDAETNTCTFHAGCCQGMPYQICSYDYAVCSSSTITIKQDDSHFHNNHGHLSHD